MQDANTARVKRLKYAATLLYGAGEEPGEPRAGWRSALAKEMGVRPHTISETAANQAANSVFDVRLAKHIDEVIVPRLLRNAEELRTIASDIMKEKEK